MFSYYFVSARTLVFAELVLNDGCWDRKRCINDNLGRVVVWIGENVFTIGTKAVVNDACFFWLWRCSGCSLVAFLTSGRRVAGGITAAS